MMEKKDPCIVFKVQRSLYPKDVVLAACYALLGQAHVVLGLDDESGDYLVKLVSREGKGVEDLRLEFHDQLINYAAYYERAESNADLKKLFIGTSLYAVEKDA